MVLTSGFRVLLVQCASNARHVLVGPSHSSYYSSDCLYISCACPFRLTICLHTCRAAELCQLTYQVRENRKIRHIMRKVHSLGISVSWALPMITILCLRVPSLKEDFVAFLLIADLPCKLIFVLVYSEVFLELLQM